MRTGNRTCDQLAVIMEEYPETIDDEDLLAMKWLEVYVGLGLPYNPRDPDFSKVWQSLFRLIRRYRKANIRERRRELAKSLYPYSPEEQARRQKRGRGGPPG